MKKVFDVFVQIIIRLLGWFIANLCFGDVKWNTVAAAHFSEAVFAMKVLA